MNANTGTPRTLDEAISNGLNECRDSGLATHEQWVKAFRAHIIDFMAQKIGKHTMTNDEELSLKIMEFWREASR